MTKYRSKFEQQFHQSCGITLEYEQYKIPYQVPASEHWYTPDFRIHATNIYLELKGRFDLPDRKKMLLVKEQFPKLRFIMVFQQPKQTISKASKTTYAEWCSKNNLEWMDAAEAKCLVAACLQGHKASTQVKEYFNL